MARNPINGIKAVVFDMDGTLCIPQPWMFPAMRQSVGLKDRSVDILTFIESLPTAAEREQALLGIEAVEAKAMKEMVPQPGLVELMKHLSLNNVSKSVLTRNLLPPVTHLITTFIPEEYRHFDHIVTREFKPPKPSPEPLLHIARLLSLRPEQLMMVGDSHDDMKSGRHAGCTTVLLRNSINSSLLEDPSHLPLVDIIVDDLSEIIPLISLADTE